MTYSWERIVHDERLRLMQETGKKFGTLLTPDEMYRFYRRVLERSRAMRGEQ